MQSFIELGLFTAKIFIVFIFLVGILMAFIALLSKGKDKLKGHFNIKNLNHKYDENTELLLSETLSKKEYKKFLKHKKATLKAKEKSDVPPKKIYVLNFHGDVRASAVAALSEEINTILSVATPKDEVVVRLESAGGLVHGYGLAAAQLARIRARQIPLVVTVDKVAASGGYMMASVANKILCAPFAIIGSIGVVVQLPNFNRLLKEKNIDFEQLTAGDFKRTLTLFGENTDEGREKLKHEIEDIHELFKNLITSYRPQLDIQKVATGEHWAGQQALELKLVDEIKTSDEYLLERSQDAELFEIIYEIKKPLLSRLTGAAGMIREKMFAQFSI